MNRLISTFRRNGSFSIVELLVAMVVLSLLVVIMASITNSLFKLWTSTNGSIKMFASARTAYGIMGVRLSEATLNTYLDYYDSSWNRRNTSSVSNDVSFVPANYGRASDLHFYCGNAATALGGTQQGHGVFFFAPLGYSNNNSTYADVPTLLNAIGYYVEWGSDSAYRPSFLSNLPQKYRYRLIENVLPTQNFAPPNGCYTNFIGSPSYTQYMQWINTGLANNTTGKSVLADNVIALILRPELSQQDATNAFNLSSAQPWNLTTNYLYDSRTPRTVPITVSTNNPTDLWFAQLPPLVRVVMVAVDEQSARRLITGTNIPTAFQLNTNWFQNPANLNTDLNSLSTQLNNAHVTYQIFNQVISIRGAEFSTQQE